MAIRHIQLRRWIAILVKVSLEISLLACLVILIRSAPIAAAPAPVTGTANDRFSLPPGAGWEDWQTVREQHADRATVRVFVRKGEAPATAKVRLVLAQRPKTASDSPQTIRDSIVQTAKQQCLKVSAKSLTNSAMDLIYELRGLGCKGQQGELVGLYVVSLVGRFESSCSGSTREFHPLQALRGVPCCPFYPPRSWGKPG